MRKTTLLFACGKSRGFTVIEMMLVLVIAGIMLSVAAPSFSSLLEKQRAKSAAADLHATLTRTRSEAIKRNASITLAAKTGDWINGWEVKDADSNVLEGHESVTGLVITASATDVTYRSSGRVSGNAAVTFEISGNYADSKRCVYLDLSGRPAIKVEACSS